MAMDAVRPVLILPRRRSGRVVALLVALLLTATSARAAEGFVAGTEDLPLMPGLATVEGAGMVFDTPQGRIVEAYAKGKVSRDAVLDFYRRTLPQLGWSALEQTVYRREGELLRLELYDKKGGLTIRFYIAPG